MRLFVLCLLVGSLSILGCGDDGAPGGTGGTGATGGTGGTAGMGGSGGTGGAGGQSDWPPNAAVYIEDNGIFHADCETDEDCAMALGYFHARDRFVQMDLQRRLSTGRLSEIVDKPLVELAGLFEPLINEAAKNRAQFSTRDGRPGEEALLDSVDPELLPILEAYAVGVNQWIDDVQNGVEGAKWPVEFESGLLDYPPEKALPWKPSDTFATFFTLVGNLTNDESKQLRARAALDGFPDDVDGNNRYLDHWSLEPIKKSPVMEVGTYPPPVASIAPKAADPAREELFRRAQGAIASLRAERKGADALRKIFPLTDIINGDIGSNNWVMGGSKTANGRTLLSNDPHLGLSQPSVWYIAHMDAKTNGSGSLHIAGLTLAGIPACVVGQNEDLAWGVTNTGLDFTDVYVEELVKNDQGEPIGVMFKGQVVEFVRVNFELPFNDGTSATRELLFVPHHGMVRSMDVDNNVALTLRWTMNDMDT
ncbi:MAG: penicillin acylase family protein, partial [Polyangiales bacterium]